MANQTSSRPLEGKVTTIRVPAVLCRAGAPIPTKIVVFVSASAPFRIPLSGSQQNAAALGK